MAILLGMESLFVQPWFLYSAYVWLTVPQLLATLAGTVGKRKNSVAIRLMAMIVGVAAGFPATGLILHLINYTYTPATVWLILIVSPLIGSAVAYCAARLVYRHLVRRTPPA